MWSEPVMQRVVHSQAERVSPAHAWPWLVIRLLCVMISLCLFVSECT